MKTTDIQNTAKAVDTRIKGYRTQLGTITKKKAAIIAEMPALLADIIALANSNDEKYQGKFDRAAAMADALKSEKGLLKEWVSVCEGRIPHKFTSNKLGQIVLGKRDAALLLTAQELKARDSKKEQDKASNAASSEKKRETLQDKANQADQYKALAETERQNKEKALKDKRLAESKLAKAGDTLAKAEQLEAELKQLDTLKVQADKQSFKIEEQEKELARLHAMEAEFIATKQENATLTTKNRELLGLVTELQNENAELKTLLALESDIKRAANS
ncbi:hypothetical protein [Methylovulum miyakonense]|uniref:hypothetical protein n=1 Tax=Methylovulum miyakonense TaxID=645578 RepID=UPI00039F2EFE|nr:hypothetical protein [Methylovulum miyakonense]